MLKSKKVFLLWLLLAITIGSCHSIDPDCDDGRIPIDPNHPLLKDDFSWERTNIPCWDTYSVAVGNNGDVWALGYDTVELHTVVYLSTDKGDTWTKKGALGTNSITINPINGYIFLSDAHYGGIFRSTDRGESWVNVSRYVNLIHDILIKPSGEIYFGIMYARSSPNLLKGIFYSSDNGDSWIQKNNGLPDEDIRSLALGPNGTLYAGTFNYGVYRSTDGGDTWLPPSNYTNVVIPNLTVSRDGSIFATASPFNNRLAFSPPSGPPIGVLKSIDGGVNWYQFNAGLIVDEVGNAIICNTITNDVFVNASFYSSEIYRNNNFGADWELKNDGMVNGVHTYEFAHSPITGQMFAATTNGLYRSVTVSR